MFYLLKYNSCKYPAVLEGGVYCNLVLPEILKTQYCLSTQLNGVLSSRVILIKSLAQETLGNFQVNRFSF